MPNYYLLGEIGLLYRIILRGALPISAVAGFTSSFAKPDTTPNSVDVVAGVKSLTSFLRKSGSGSLEMKQFTKTIGYTTFGIMTGLSYPISFPGLTIYTFYKEYKASVNEVSTLHPLKTECVCNSTKSTNNGFDPTK